MKSKRVFAWLLTVAMQLSLLPGAALAADGTITSSEGDVAWSDGTYTLTENAVITNRINVRGNVTLVLESGKLTANSA